ncbi:ABC transporter permease [Brucella gallinifaecis]|uniref:ABC transporter permease n=1 Tax=Brucella gallinifaecis TaxID=215590 RepID=A0A502BQG0_9HYPH|nr:ABC transporter permease [Brucella gallinifaecis]TPF75378.1 ABC transporter permease [Brucella gallinifaecis]
MILTGELFKVKNIPAILAMLFLMTVIFLASFATVLPLQDPVALDTLNILSSPSREHWLGTDELGRDLLSRIVYGAQISLGVAFAAVIIAGTIGTIVGVSIGFAGPRVEAALMRIIDLMISIPETFVAIIVLALFGGSLPTLILTIGFIYCPQFVRVIFDMTKSIRSRDYVLAAKSLGAGKLRLIRTEALPNLYSIIAVQTSVTFSFALLMEAGLSFLGLGVQPPISSWGQMVGTLKNYIFINPLPIIFPACALLLVVLAVNLLGDFIQDILNPELRK